MLFWEEIVDTKAIIIIRISKKIIQHNGQKKKYKRTNNDLQNIHIKLKIENNLCDQDNIFVLFEDICYKLLLACRDHDCFYSCMWTTVIVNTSCKVIVYHSLVACDLIQTKRNYNSFLFLYPGSYCKINFSKIVNQICFFHKHIESMNLVLQSVDIKLGAHVFQE